MSSPAGYQFNIGRYRAVVVVTPEHMQPAYLYLSPGALIAADVAGIDFPSPSGFAADDELPAGVITLHGVIGQQFSSS